MIISLTQSGITLIFGVAENSDLYQKLMALKLRSEAWLNRNSHDVQKR